MAANFTPQLSIARSAPFAERHAEMGFYEGWGACADQVKELAEA